MKHKLFVLLSVLALLFALQVAPVYAGDDKGAPTRPALRATAIFHNSNPMIAM